MRIIKVIRVIEDYYRIMWDIKVIRVIEDYYRIMWDIKVIMVTRFIMFMRVSKG